MLIIYDTLVLGLELPATVNAAINRKIEQYYLVQEYAFRVDREKKESERKQIEANGIRDFQQTVTQGISNSYVRWRGIEATLQLAQSPNTKIVIIGSGKDGLPVILGNVDTPMQPNPATTPAAAPVPDNSEAARAEAGRREPAAPGKDAGQQSAEPGRTAVADRGAARLRTPPDTPAGRPEQHTRRTARQAVGGPPAEPRTSWTWSELQDLISRTVGREERPPVGRHNRLADGRAGATSGGRRAAASGCRTSSPPRQPERAAAAASGSRDSGRPSGFANAISRTHLWRRTPEMVLAKSNLWAVESGGSTPWWSRYSCEWVRVSFERTSRRRR